MRVKLRLDVLANVKRDALGAWVLVKERVVVKIGVVKAVQNFFERGLELGKVKQHSALVQSRPANVDKNLIVVAVQGLALSVIVAQKMRRRKIILNSYFEHNVIIARSARALQ